jgi:nickel/cobalt exporter
MKMSSSDRYTHSHNLKDEGFGVGSIITLGVSGGMVPCLPAIALLLVAISSGEVGQGLFLITLFSIGLAMALITIGITACKASSLIKLYVSSGTLGKKISVSSALIVTLLGFALVVRGIIHFI